MASASTEARRVTSLELFFDLVFVFTLTQLSTLLENELNLVGLVRVLLIFGVAWWMYGGYAWLANAAAPDRTSERLLLLVGMAGFMVVALAIPGAFGDDGVALGLGYLTVVIVHTGLYALRTPNIWRVTPVNVASALLVIGAGLIADGGRYAAWAAALALQALSPLFVRVSGRFHIEPAHFAERHSGLLIVAFGESVVAIGIGEAGHALTFGLVVAAMSGLTLSAALWWAFFGAGDDERAEATMTAAPAHARPGLALNGYFYAYIPMLLGVVVIAAGVKRSIGHPGQAAPAAALALAGGVALFLAGDVVFRYALRAGPLPVRSMAAVAALATTAIGALLTVETQLLALVAVLALMLVAELRPPATAPEPPPRGSA